MSEPTKHYWLYVLKLEHDKYYIGITSRKNPQDRINEHLNGFYSAQWVKRYKALGVAELIDIGHITTNEANRLETRRTLQYMDKYGISSVRGGAYSYSGDYVKFIKIWRADMFYSALGLICMTVAFMILFFASLTY